MLIATVATFQKQTCDSIARSLPSIFAPLIIASHAEVLARPKFAFPAHDIAAVIAILGDKANWSCRRPALPLPNADDAKFFYCAMAA